MSPSSTVRASMSVDRKEGYIAFFDSGVGGLTVLHQAMALFPHEHFLYYADSANTPYGLRPSDEIDMLVQKAICDITTRPVKAIVLACNTATSISADNLRVKYDLPIIGMEPAVKIAADSDSRGRIVVLATEATLRERKYHDLITNLHIKERVEDIRLPDLITMAEEFILDGGRVETYLAERLAQIDWTEVQSVVLGCTHFIYYRNALEKIIPDEVNILDGNEGTVRRLRDVLGENIRMDGAYQLLTLLSGHHVDNEIILPYLHSLSSKSLFSSHITTQK